MNKVLRLDASAKITGSTGRALGDGFLDQLAKVSDLEVKLRDLSQGLEFLDQAWVEANFTAADERSAAQKQRLDGSDVLVQELFDMDVLLITMPLYNFGMPAVLENGGGIFGHGSGVIVMLRAA